MSSGGYERDSDASLSRDSYERPDGGVGVRTHETPYGAPRQDGDAGWGRGMGGFASQRRPMSPIETRPSFLTSEFIATVLAIVALGITAATMDIVDARLTWILTAAMVFGYVVSRGLAKAGTKSHAVDPREHLLQAQSAGGVETSPQTQEQHGAEPGYGQVTLRPGRSSYGYGPPRRGVETRPFFLTSEFVGVLAAIVALACTAAAMPNLGARLTWILIAAMVFTYALSRGIAKAGTHSASFDPREHLLGGGGASGEPDGGSAAVRGSAPVETRPFFLTSEFVGTLLAILAIAISAATIDILNVRLTWILITAMVCGYVLSRGLAKIGVASHSFDPRDQLLQRAAGQGRHERQQPYAQR